MEVVQEAGRDPPDVLLGSVPPAELSGSQPTLKRTSRMALAPQGQRPRTRLHSFLRLRRRTYS